MLSQGREKALSKTRERRVNPRPEMGANGDGTYGRGTGEATRWVRNKGTVRHSLRRLLCTRRTGLKSVTGSGNLLF